MIRKLVSSPTDPDRVPGDGYFLPGLKAYIIALLAALVSAALAWADSHTHGAAHAALPFVQKYLDAICVALAAGAIAALRAAIAKVEDRVTAWLTSHHLPIPTELTRRIDKL